MNFFKKRKRGDEVETTEQPPAKKPTRSNRLFSWIKDKFSKNCNQEQQTPVNRRTVRYVMTPQNAFSPSAVALDIRNQNFYELHSVVNVTESKNYEFKAAGGRYPTQVLPEHIRKYGSGFLNSNGGVLLAGILDNGVVQGVSYCNQSYKKIIINAIKKEFDNFRPHVGHSKYSVNFIPVSYPQNFRERVYGNRSFVSNTYVIEIAIRQGDPGELYEDGLHQVFLRREGSVEGPLSPIKIKELVLQSIREVFNDKKRKKPDSDSLNETTVDNPCTKEETPANQPIKKKGKISPITFNLKDAERVI